MAGEFKGITDEEWALFEDILPPEHKTRGMPHSSFRYIINTLLYVEITGCRWCDVPKSKEDRLIKRTQMHPMISFHASSAHCRLVNVIPAKAGIHNDLKRLDSQSSLSS